MRIMLVSQSFPPDIGGEERHVEALAKGLAARGHEVLVCTQRPEGWEPDESLGGSGGRILRLASTAGRVARSSSPTRIHAPPAPDPEFSRQLLRAARDFGPEVVHVHDWTAYSAASVSHKLGVPLAMTVHNYGYLCPTQRLMFMDEKACDGPGLVKCLSCAREHYGVARGLPTVAAKRGYSRWLNGRLDHIAAVSSSVARESRLAGSGVPWSVIPNFIPASLFEGAPPVDQADVISFLGDVHSHKGVPQLLEAYGRIDGPKPRLLCVGKDMLAPGTLIPEGAEVLGPQPHAEAMRVLRSARFSVIPSVFRDPCPTTVLEAMAAGKAVVASAVGGITDMVVPDETGLLVPPEDVVALEVALRRMIDDPGMATAMGQRALGAVHAFTDEVVVGRLEELYDGLVGARKAA